MRRQPKIRWRDVHGILLLDKPQGLSSNQALQKARILYRAAKGGHTGSLDPLATGLLPLCFGEATKIAGLLIGSGKAYETECLLGVSTDSADANGNVIETRPVPELDVGDIEKALQPFRGTIMQVPPMYSALKRDGERLYELARRGESIEIEPREVDVHRFDLIERQGHRLRLHVECGSGTYVRSLVSDLGESLGCGAHVTALRRLWVDPFRAPEMVTLDDLESAASRGVEALDKLLLPLEEGLRGYPEVILDEGEATRLRQGQSIQVAMGPGTCLAKSADGRLLALAETDSNGLLRTLRGFNLD